MATSPPELTPAQLQNLEPLNSIPGYACGKCGQTGRALVFVSFLRWACGHQVPLPPLSARPRRRRR